MASIDMFKSNYMIYEEDEGEFDPQSI